MAKALELSGKRFGRLKVIYRGINDRWNESRWLCRCDCGRYTFIRGDSLRSGQRSCGWKHAPGFSRQPA
jgi:hypothetical protein